MPAVKFTSKIKYKDKAMHNRKKSNASKMRETKKRKTDDAESWIGEAETTVLSAEGEAHVSDPLRAGNIALLLSASASKLRRLRNRGDEEDAQNARQRWCICVACGQPKDLLADVPCPACEEGSLNISAGAPVGFVQELTISCATSGYSPKKFSSARINNLNNRHGV